MVCFIVPLAGAIITSIIWEARNGGPAGWWLNLLLYGGALFGAIDHLWFGEFFLGFQNLLNGTAPLSDIMLGFTITGAIFGSWGMMMGMARINPTLGKRMGILKTSQQ